MKCLQHVGTRAIYHIRYAKVRWAAEIPACPLHPHPQQSPQVHRHTYDHQNEVRLPQLMHRHPYHHQDEVLGHIPPKN
jgi:hypothetical protein